MSTPTTITVTCDNIIKSLPLITILITFSLHLIHLLVPFVPTKTKRGSHHHHHHYHKPKNHHLHSQMVALVPTTTTTTIILASLPPCQVDAHSQLLLQCSSLK